jgi:hypothetical protein
MITLRHFIPLLLAISLAGGAPGALAKAAFAGEEEMIQVADVIAIVNITKVEETRTKGEYWTFSEVAHATVEQTLKGTLPQNVKLSGGEDFICAQVHFAPGRQLVFLRREGELLTGCNWHLGVRPIKETQVEWYVAGQCMELSWQPLAGVLERIKNTPAKSRDK